MYDRIRSALPSQAHDLAHDLAVQGQAAQDEGRARVVRLRMRLHRERAVMEDEGNAGAQLHGDGPGGRDSGGR
jgi:hypothetical protein